MMGLASAPVKRPNRAARVGWGGDQATVAAGATEDETAGLGAADGECAQFPGARPGGAAIAVVGATAAAPAERG